MASDCFRVFIIVYKILLVWFYQINLMYHFCLFLEPSFCMNYVFPPRGKHVRHDVSLSRLSLNKAMEFDKCDALSSVNQLDTSTKVEGTLVEVVPSVSWPLDMYMRHFLNC